MRSPRTTAGLRRRRPKPHFRLTWCGRHTQVRELIAPGSRRGAGWRHGAVANWRSGPDGGQTRRRKQPIARFLARRKRRGRRLGWCSRAARIVQIPRLARVLSRDASSADAYDPVPRNVLPRRPRSRAAVCRTCGSHLSDPRNCASLPSEVALPRAIMTREWVKLPIIQPSQEPSSSIICIVVLLVQ